MKNNQFDEWAEEYNCFGKEMPFFQKWIFKKMKEEIDKKGIILDLGTGDGRLLIYLSNTSKKLIGLDSSKNMLNETKKNFNKLGLKGKFILSELPKIPLSNKSADYIISNAALHHVKDKEKLYKEILRVLKKHGKLIVADCFEKEDKEYKNEQNKLRKDKVFWNKYLKSLNRCEKEFLNMQKKLKVKHPIEYHITPKKTKEILEKVGFKEIKITPMPKLDLIYSGVKK